MAENKLTHNISQNRKIFAQNTIETLPQKQFFLPCCVEVWRRRRNVAMLGLLASPLLCDVSSVYLFIRVAILICEQGSSEVLTQIRPSNSIPLHPLLSSQHFLLLPTPAPVATHCGLAG